MKLYFSLSMGFCVVICLFLLGTLFPHAVPLVDMVLKPGDFCATQIFGGMHGLQPLLMAVFVDVLLCGSSIYLALWALGKARHASR